MQPIYYSKLNELKKYHRIHFLSEHQYEININHTQNQKKHLWLNQISLII